MANEEFKQLNIEETPKTLDDFLYVKDGVVILRGVMQTENFIAGKRGVQMKFEGLNASGGTIQGANVSSGSTTITGALTHTGSTVGFYNKAPTAQASDIGAITIGAGTGDGTTQDVTASFNQTILNNNFADLASKINSIRTVLRNLGLTT